MNDEVKFFGDGPKEIVINTSAQVYRLRDWLMEGKRVTCDVARLQLGIGGSALPRRVKDCRDYLYMQIKARWVPYLTSMGTKTRIREYYMEKNEIEAYLINSMGLKVDYKMTLQKNQA